MLKQLVMLMQKASPTTYRYLRLRIDTSSATNIYLAEVYWAVSGTDYPTSAMTSNIAPSPLVSSASSEVTYAAWNAFDHVIGSFGWLSNTAGFPQWLTLDLGAGNGIFPTGIGIAGASGVYPTGFTCLGSNTGSFAGEEYTFYTASGLTTGWTDRTRRNFTF